MSALCQCFPQGIECAWVAMRQLGLEVLNELDRIGDLEAASFNRHDDDRNRQLDALP